MPFAALLVALTGPIARQVLLSLGIGLVTYAGVDVAVSALLSQARTAWASGPGGGAGAAAQLIAMAGVNTALSIIAGGISARVTMLVLKKFQVV